MRGKYRGEDEAYSGALIPSIGVSVPLRGKYRGEADEVWKDVSYYEGVSVPLRGKYRGEVYWRSPHAVAFCGFRPLAG